MFVEVFCADAKIGDFSFEDIDLGFNVGTVELEIYARNLGPANNDMVEIAVYDGSTWAPIGTTTPGNAWGWVSVAGVDVTETLDTPAKINAAKAYFTKITMDGGRNEVEPAIEEIQVDAMRLRVYTAGYLEDVTT
ncbi:MAG: hypothetical protein GTO14_11575, partial [Anaerolineales bacterium]|nr:hypothetical protein [Anaerolineales bacterium]